MGKFSLFMEDDNTLENLRALTGAKTKSDAVRDALSVYQLLVDMVRGGAAIHLVQDGEDTRVLHVTTLEKARSLAKDAKDTQSLEDVSSACG